MRLKIHVINTHESSLLRSFARSLAKGHGFKMVVFAMCFSGWCSRASNTFGNPSSNTIIVVVIITVNRAPKMWITITAKHCLAKLHAHANIVCSFFFAVSTVSAQHMTTLNGNHRHVFEKKNHIIQFTSNTYQITLVRIFQRLNFIQKKNACNSLWKITH